MAITSSADGEMAVEDASFRSSEMERPRHRGSNLVPDVDDTLFVLSLQPVAMPIDRARSFPAESRHRS